MKKILIVAISICLVFALAACSMVTVNPEKDAAQVVAEVNGTPLYKGDYVSGYQNMMSAYGMTEDYFLAQTDGRKQLDQFRTDVLNEMINQELLYQHAVAEGLVDTSDTARAEKKKEIEDSLAQTKQLLLEDAQASGAENAEAEAQKTYDQYLKDVGMNDIEKAIDNALHYDGVQAMTEKIENDVTYTEEQAKEYYDMQVQMQEGGMGTDETNYDMYSMFGPIYYYPQGSTQVQQYLIPMPEEAATQVTQKTAEGDEAGAKAARDAGLKEIETQANAVLKRVQDGEEPDAIKEAEEGIQTETVTVVQASTSFAQEIKDAAAALKAKGDVSPLVATDEGYYILSFLKDASGAVPFDDVKETIMTSQLQQEKTNKVSEIVKGWADESTIKRYEDRLKINQ